MTFFDFAKGRKESCTTDPGMYNIPSCFGQGPKYSFKSRPKDFKPQYAPKYNNLPSTLNANGVSLGAKNMCLERKVPKEDTQPELVSFPSSIGSGPKVAIHERAHLKPDQTPGPGAYDPVKPDFTQVISMGVGKRFDFIEDHTIVPPGTYDIPSTIEVKQVSKRKKKDTSQRRPKFEKRQHPGPIYDFEKPLGSDARKTSFPKGPRDVPINDNPGPGEYDVQVPFGHSSRIQTAFHSRPRDREKDVTKAPYYSVPSAFQTKKKSMASRPSTSYETPSPGPCYELPTTMQPKKKTIGIRTKHKDPMADIPSPDAYFRSDAPKDKSMDVVCPFDAPYDRSIINYKEASSLPGPGAYETSLFQFNTCKGYTIQKKTKNEPRPDTAAPYRALSSTLGGYSYTIGARDV